MLLLRIFLMLALGLTINSATASEVSDDTTILFPQGEQPLLLAGKLGSRRRDDNQNNCGTSPNVWTLNICESAPFCYVTPLDMNLWLAKDKRTGQTERLTIVNNFTGQKTERRWKAKNPTLHWPIKDMPIQSGTSYLMILKKGRHSFSNGITLYQIPADLSISEQVREMKQKGCIPQTEMLLEKHPA
ncbi:hypothetical protein [Candidatus Parabeggiatoa sp. HSG14]|uniref:hypothetical protein n=1 Tax=Candidatus Parabeggiatoa sp. HSG14 TaxID=3055593 RepID=UPI0025A6AD69|nr:hypothetical protein [Thiotrichales bacterium HSG14]